MNKPDIDHDWDEFSKEWHLVLATIGNLSADGIQSFVKLAFVHGYREGYGASLTNMGNDVRQALHSLEQTEIA